MWYDVKCDLGCLGTVCFPRVKNYHELWWSRATGSGVGEGPEKHMGVGGAKLGSQN